MFICLLVLFMCSSCGSLLIQIYCTLDIMKRFLITGSRGYTYLGLNVKPCSTDWLFTSILYIRTFMGDETGILINQSD